MKNGVIHIDGYKFWWCKKNESSEVFGHLEEDDRIVPGFSGWYRTTDPNEAVKVVESQLALQQAEKKLKST